MPTKIALILHIERLHVDYTPGQTYFTLNISAGFDQAVDTDVSMTFDSIRRLLLPWVWAVPKETPVTFKAYTTGAGITPAPLNTTLVTVPTGATPPLINVAGIETPLLIKVAGVDDYIDYRIKTLLALQAPVPPDPTASPFLFDSSNVRKPAVRADESFPHILNHLSSLSAPLPQALSLSLAFTIPTADITSAGAASIVAVPVFPNFQGVAGNILSPSPQPNSSTPGSDFVTWNFVDGSDNIEAVAYINPLLLTEDVSPSSLPSSIDLTRLLVTGDRPVDRIDWGSRLEHRVADLFNLSRCLVETARSQRDAFFSDPPPGRASDFYPLLRKAVVAAARDLADVGLRQMADGGSLVDYILSNPDLVNNSNVGAMRQALANYQPNLKDWAKLLSDTVKEISDTRAITSIVDTSQVIERTLAQYDDEMDELERIVGALSKPEVLRAVVMAQWAAATIGTGDAADFWRNCSTIIGKTILPAINIQHRLALANIGPIWQNIVPTHTRQNISEMIQLGGDPNAVPFSEKYGSLTASLISYFQDRLISTPTPSSYETYFPKASELALANLGDLLCLTPTDTVSKRLQELVQSVLTGIKPDNSDPADGNEDPTPVDRAHPLLLQADRVSGKTGAPDEDTGDLQRRIAGVCTFIRTRQSNGNQGKWRSLNMAQIRFRLPRRIRDFELADATTLLGAIGTLPSQQLRDVLNTHAAGSGQTLLTWLNTVPAINDDIFDAAVTSPIHLQNDVADYLTRLSSLSPESRLLAKWWVIDDALPSLFPPRETIVHPCALVPARLGERNGLRQSFVKYDNHPLVGPSPAEGLAALPVDAPSTVDALILFGFVSGRDDTGATSDSRLDNWALLPPLMDGAEYEALLVTSTVSGALPKELALKDYPFQLRLRKDAQTDLESIGNPYVRTSRYLRRRPVSAPYRSSSDGIPRTEDPETELTPPSDVFPLGYEYPSEVTAKLHGPSYYYFDRAQYAGTLGLSDGNFTAILENIQATSASATVRFTIEQATLKDGASSVISAILTIAADGSAIFRLESSAADTTIKRSAASLPIDKTLDSFDLRFAGTADTTGVQLSIAAQVNGTGWQLGDSTVLPTSTALGSCRLVVEGMTDVPFNHDPPLAASGISLETDRGRRERILILPNPSLGKNPTTASTYEYYVSAPHVDLNTWDRWLARDQYTKPTPAERQVIQSLRTDVWSKFHQFAPLHHDPGSLGPRITIDDPAVEKLYLEVIQRYPSANTVDGKWLDLTDGTGTALPGAVQRNPIKVRCTLSPVAAPAVTLSSGIAQVTLPPGGIYQIRIWTAVQSLFHDAPTEGVADNRRFPLRAGKELRRVLDPSGAEHVLVSSFDEVIETATPELPLPHVLMSALRTQTAGGHVLLRLDKRIAIAGRVFDTVSDVTIERQHWRWQGRPLTDFPSFRRINLDLPVNDDLSPGNYAPTWDAEGFSTIEDSDITSSDTRLKYHDTESLLLDHDLTHDERAQYLRFSVVARSRYAGVFSLLPDPNAPASVRSTTDPNDITRDKGDIWTRHFIACRRTGGSDVPRPKIKMLVPLTQSNIDATASDILVVLREPWFDVGGITESLEAEIVRTVAEGGPLPEVGVDPILSSRKLSLPVSFQPLRGAIGQTFDRATNEPVFTSSSFRLSPPVFNLLSQPGDESSFVIEERAKYYDLRLIGIEVGSNPESFNWQVKTSGVDTSGNADFETLVVGVAYSSNSSNVIFTFSGLAAVTLPLPGANPSLNVRIILKRDTAPAPPGSVVYLWVATAAASISSGEWKSLGRVERRIKDSSLAELALVSTGRTSKLPVNQGFTATNDQSWMMAKVRFRRKLEIDGPAVDLASSPLDTILKHSPVEVRWDTVDRQGDYVIAITVINYVVTITCHSDGKAELTSKGKSTVIPQIQSQLPFRIAATLRYLDGASAGQLEMVFYVSGVRTDLMPVHFGELNAGNAPIALSATVTAAGGTPIILPAKAKIQSATLASDFTPPEWVQFLPNTARIIDALTGMPISPIDIKLDVSDPPEAFRLVKDSTPLVLDLADEDGEHERGGRNRFSHYLMVTQLISDVRGRQNEERYVGLYEMDESGVCRSVEAMWSDNPQAAGEILLAERAYVVRKLDVQSRLDQLSANSMAAKYLIGSTNNGGFVTMRGLRFLSPTPQVVRFAIVSSSPELAALEISSDNLGLITVQADVHGQKKTVLQSADVNSEPFDLRIRIATESSQVFGFQLRTKRGEWTPLVTIDAAASDVVKAFSASVSLDATNSSGPVVTYLPPTNSIDPWDVLFPDLDTEPDGNDTVSRIVGVSPPVNQHDLLNR